MVEVTATTNDGGAVDSLLEVSAACDKFADHLSNIICRADPTLKADVVAEVVSIELFACAQDMARLFAPLTEGEREVLRSTVERMRDEGIV